MIESTAERGQLAFARRTGHYERGEAGRERGGTGGGGALQAEYGDGATVIGEVANGQRRPPRPSHRSVNKSGNGQSGRSSSSSYDVCVRSFARLRHIITLRAAADGARIRFGLSSVQSALWRVKIS